MGSVHEFSVPVRLFLKAYPWRRIDPVPWTAIQHAVIEAALAMLENASPRPPVVADFAL